MLALNALSGAVYHYELFGEESNLGSSFTQRSVSSSFWTTSSLSGSIFTPMI